MVLGFFSKAPILVRGGGDLASGVILRLFRAGFPVVATELNAPAFVRRTVCFGEAVYAGSIEVEGITAQRIHNVDDIPGCWAQSIIPIIVDPDAYCMRLIEVAAVVDARMAKINLSTTIDDAPFVVGIGPGFIAGNDCHAVIETNRGHDLGRVIWSGSAEADTGEPGVVGGKTHSRVLRAPTNGHVHANAVIGEVVHSGQTIATINNHPVIAPFTGIVRGIIHEQVWVEAGTKIGDVDPRSNHKACFTISDKSLAVGGGVVEAVLSAPQVRAFLGQQYHEVAKGL